MQKQAAFYRAFELVRRSTTTQQKRRKKQNNKKVHCPTYREGDYILLQYAVTAAGQSPELLSPWIGPYKILKFINDVNYKIEELSTRKQLIVYYDRMKPYHRQPPRPTSIPERQLANSKVPTQRPWRPKNNDHCVVTLPSRSLSVPPARPTHGSQPSSPAVSMTSPFLPLTLPRSSPIPSMPPPSRQSQRPQPLLSPMIQRSSVP